MNIRKIAGKAGTVLSLAAVSSLVMASSVFAQVPVVGGLNSGWWSAQTLVNVGGADANVDATAYELEGGNDGSAQVAGLSNLANGGSVTILPKEIAGSGPSVEDIATGSMVISSNQKLVAVVALTNAPPFPGSSLGTAGGTSAGFYEGTSSDNTAQNLSFPVAKRNYFGATTVFFVQNAGTTTADVTVTYSWPNGGSATDTKSVAPNLSHAFEPPAGMEGQLGSASASSTVNLAGAVIELESGANVVSKAHKAGRALTDADKGNELYVTSFKKSFGSPKFSSAIGIQGDAALTGQIIYTCADKNPNQTGCTPGDSFTVNFTTSGPGVAYSAWPFSADHSALPDNSLYSAKVVISSGGPAVADVGETSAAINGAAPYESQYVGIPGTQAGTEWTCPSDKQKYFQGEGAAIVFPLDPPATVNVEYTVSALEGNINTTVGETYTIENFVIASGNQSFYDVANGIAPANISWKDGKAMPPTALGSGFLASVKVTSDENIIVTSNEAPHFTSSSSDDGRQYACFKTN